METKSRKLKFVFIVYWVLLTYIFAALVWWFIALTRQNTLMANFMRQELRAYEPSNQFGIDEINSFEKRKRAQYLGEGAIFFLLISTGAVFVFRSVRKQIKDSQQQQHFMMAITHELKTPIAITKLNLETLLKRKLEESQQQKLLNNTIHEANRLNALCNNLLLSSQIESAGYQPTRELIDFSGLVAACMQEYINRFPQREIQFDGASACMVLGDSLHLQLAINNLIDNAIKYSPKNSLIRVSLETKSSQIYLHIADEGNGIPDSEKKKVFTKYYRLGNAATKAAKGTGLGLYLTKRIIEQHSGSLQLNNNQPQGCVFTIELKIAK
jgi:signal transduction histidine kinase